MRIQTWQFSGGIQTLTVFSDRFVSKMLTSYANTFSIEVVQVPAGMGVTRLAISTHPLTDKPKMAIWGVEFPKFFVPVVQRLGYYVPRPYADIEM